MVRKHTKEILQSRKHFLKDQTGDQDEGVPRGTERMDHIPGRHKIRA